MEEPSEHIPSSEVLSLASDAGHLMLENGAEIFRVEDTMRRISEHYGAGNENFFVLSNGIFTTGESYANVEFIPIRGSRLDKVVGVSRLSHDILKKNLPFAEARRRLGEIRTMPPKPLLENLLGAAFGCGGFCAIFGGSPADCLVSLVAGTVLSLFLSLVSRFRLSKILESICAGIVGTLLCILADSIGIGDNLANMVVGTMILLIPGVAFTNGLRDISNEDYIGGITRLTDALLVFLGIAIGVILAFLCHSWVSGGMIMLSGPGCDSFTGRLPIQLAAALVGTTSFAVLFGVPREFYLDCGFVGMAGWAVYLIVSRYTPLTVYGGTFFAALLVTLLSRAFAVWRKCPGSVFLICGIFPLIPGGGVFWSSYYVVSSRLGLAADAGFKSIGITVAIILGIIVTANLTGRKHSSMVR